MFQTDLLKDQHILITGGGTGLGRSMALRFAGLGARIFLAGRREEPLRETAAEIDRIERDGADIVGMTGMPEAALARELELPYAAITVVANHAAGRGDSKLGIQFASLEDILRESMERVRRIIEMICIDGK